MRMYEQLVFASLLVMLMVNTTLKVLFVEMYVNVIFVKLLVQHNEFNSC